MLQNMLTFWDYGKPSNNVFLIAFHDYVKVTLRATKNDLL